MSAKQLKQELRNTFLTRRDRQPLEEKRASDRVINEKLIDLVDDGNHRNIHVFLPMKGELNIYPFIQHLMDKRLNVICPKSLPGGQMENYILRSLTKVTKGIFGTTYPADSEKYDGDIDLIIVPGLAFSIRNERLGYGGGYYDRFLINHTDALKIAPAYKFQIVNSLPIENHDIKVDEVLTPY